MCVNPAEPDSLQRSDQLRYEQNVFSCAVVADNVKLALFQGVCLLAHLIRSHPVLKAIMQMVGELLQDFGIFRLGLRRDLFDETIMVSVPKAERKIR